MDLLQHIAQNRGAIAKALCSHAILRDSSGKLAAVCSLWRHKTTALPSDVVDDFVCDIAELRGVLDLPPEALQALVEQGALPLEELVMTNILPTAVVEFITSSVPGPTAELERVSFTLLISMHSDEVEGITSPTTRLAFDSENDSDFSEEDMEDPLLSEEVLQRPEFYGSQMTLCSEAGDFCTASTERTYPTNKYYFTLQEVIDNIVDFEVASRPNTLWLGGGDRDHVFFEGLVPYSDGRFEIYWGS